MQVFKDIDALPDFKNAVLTIGSFDGVHQGHKKILHQVVEEARKINGTAILITFYPHPGMVVKNRDTPLLNLTTPAEKYNLIAEQGIKNIVEIPFDENFASMSADDYVKNFLIGKFHPKIIITGFDHKFGNNREGDYTLLEKYAVNHAFKLIEISAHLLQDVKISSTKIRTALLNADIETATKYLGYPYFFSGTVIHGHKKGRTIGFPTANIAPEDAGKLIPADGVYAVKVLVNGKDYEAMMNIGVRPTIGNNERLIEVSLFNFDRVIYGELIKITVFKYLRPEEKFDSLESLKKQIKKDKEDSLQYFASNPA